jgi:hypothetical protein
MTTTALRPRTIANRQVVIAAFWSLIGFIGLSVIAGQIINILEGAPAGEALSLALAGFAIAVYGCLHTVHALNTAAPSRARTLQLVWRNGVEAQATTAAHR